MTAGGFRGASSRSSSPRKRGSRDFSALPRQSPGCPPSWAWRRVGFAAPLADLHPRESGDPETSAPCLGKALDARLRGHDGGWVSRCLFQIVIPANAGIQRLQRPGWMEPWMPAFAGVTSGKCATGRTVFALPGAPPACPDTPSVPPPPHLALASRPSVGHCQAAFTRPSCLSSASPSDGRTHRKCRTPGRAHPSPCRTRIQAVQCRRPAGAAAANRMKGQIRHNVPLSAHGHA